MPDNQFSNPPQGSGKKGLGHPAPSNNDDDLDDGPMSPWEELADFFLFARDRFSDGVEYVWSFFTTRDDDLETGTPEELPQTPPLLRRQKHSETVETSPRVEKLRESSPPRLIRAKQKTAPVATLDEQQPPKTFAHFFTRWTQFESREKHSEPDNFAPRVPLVLWFWNLWSRTVWPLTVTAGSIAIALTIYLLLDLLFTDQGLIKQNQAQAAIDVPMMDLHAELSTPTLSPPSNIDASPWTGFEIPSTPAVTPPPAFPPPQSITPSLSMQRYYTSWVPNIQLPANNILRVVGRGYYHPAYRHTVTALSPPHAPWRRHIPVAAAPSSPWLTDAGPYYQPGLHFLEVSNTIPHEATTDLDGHLPSSAKVSFQLKKTLPAEHSTTTDANIGYEIINIGTSPLSELLIDEQLWIPDATRPDEPILHDEAEYRVHQLLSGETASSEAVFPTKDLQGKMHAYAYITASSQVESVTRVSQHQIALWITLPPQATVGKPTRGTVHLKNQGTTTYPGGTLTLAIPEAFESSGGNAPQSQINILGPGQSQDIPFDVKPVSASNTYITARLDRENTQPLERHAPITILALQATPRPEPQVQPRPEPMPEPKPESKPEPVPPFEAIPQKPVTTSKPVSTRPSPSDIANPFFEPTPVPKVEPKPQQPPSPPMEIPKEAPERKSTAAPTCCQPCQAQNRSASQPIQQPVFYPYYEPAYYPMIVPAGYAY